MEEGIIVSIDILSMRKWKEEENILDIAIPALAYECEVSELQERHLDAYEITVLRLVELGLSTNGIASTLNATESLIGDILGNLQGKELVEKKPNQPWKLTEDGEKLLKGKKEELVSEHKTYGYMFMNVLKREFLPYFYHGNIEKISRYYGKKAPFLLTLEGSIENTFLVSKVKQRSLYKAYRNHLKNSLIVQNYKKGNNTSEEAEQQLFVSLESFDELEEQEKEVQEIEDDDLEQKKYIKVLHKEPKEVYIIMRIIIDLTYPGGYRVESPFDLQGIDNEYYLRQIQWLCASERAMIEEDLLGDFLEREIKKCNASYEKLEKDFSIFVLEKIPRLKLCKDRFSTMYEDMSRIYDLMRLQNSSLEKENIVSSIYRYVIEVILNSCFKSYSTDTLEKITKRVFNDMKVQGEEAYRTAIISNAKLLDVIPWGEKVMKNAIERLGYTNGNSIVEKFMNLLILHYYISNQYVAKLIGEENIAEYIKIMDRINKIRRKVSHDTNNRFEEKDYEYFIQYVFPLIDGLLKPYVEE